MLKKIRSLFNKNEAADKQVLYQAAVNEANRIFNEYPSPRGKCTSSPTLPAHNLSTIESKLRFNKSWQRGFVQAIYDRRNEFGVLNQIDYMKAYSEFTRLVFLYAPTTVGSHSLEKALWELGYASYIEFINKGYMPF